MLTEGQDKIKETLSISDKISDILSEEADAGSQHVIDSWLAQNEQNKALFNKICILTIPYGKKFTTTKTVMQNKHSTIF